MKQVYKNFHGTKSEYIAFCVERVKFWARQFAAETDSQLRSECHSALEKASEMLLNEGITWQEIEKIEIDAFKEFS